MQTQKHIASWHKESYSRLLNETLPELLALRLPLTEYSVNPVNSHTHVLTIVLASRNGDIEVAYQLPQPDERGVFYIDGEPRVVIPYVMDDDLVTAEVRCVGERLFHYIDSQLGEAPENLPWDAPLLQAWLPLDRWFSDFFKTNAQVLDQTNWLATQRHLRAIYLPNRVALISASHIGRVCPFETPEGPNIGRVLRIAVGAEIRDGVIVVVDDSPEAALGVSASMIPLLEHDDPNRLLMGANMMGQWILPPHPEPALVQSGNEPNASDFWCGRNLLTAFISWGGDTIEDGIVISESAASRLDYHHPAEVGDKISNRHGTKGVISRILPDDQMPHLADGTPVELIYSFMGIPGRLNFGQVREALWGRIARIEGAPVVAPPFNARCEDELRRRMAQANIPPNGMEVLTLRHGLTPDQAEGHQLLAGPSTVGWVYWGKTVHLARRKIIGGADAPLQTARERGLQRQAELEYRALRDAGAFETALETFNTRAAGVGSDGLSDQVVSGTVQGFPSPSPGFTTLQKRLAVAGIQARLDGESLSFGFSAPQGGILHLAKPVRHPWLWERELAEIGVCQDIPEYNSIAEVNARLARMLESNAPASLVDNAYTQLQTLVDGFFTVLLTPAELRFGARVQFSGRALIAPGPEFGLDQVGLAEELAWRLFGPHVKRELGDENAIQNRTHRAAQALDEIMARSWIIINRAPSLTPTAILAFKPVRIPEDVIRINPLICPWLNADFDGDQVAVFLPLTSTGQHEAGERLSVAGHLARDPGLVRSLVPTKAAVWGLAKLSLTPEGKDEIRGLVDVSMPNGYLTQLALEDAMWALLMDKGIDHTLGILEKLTQRGFEVAQRSGASVSPFIGSSIQLQPLPQGNDPEEWRVYADQITDQIAARVDFDDLDMGAHLLTSKARKLIPPPRVYTLLCATRGVVNGIDGHQVVIRSSQVSGLTPEEMYACVASSREGLARVVHQWEKPEQYALTSAGSQSFNVLARARSAVRPGIVFARAAAIREVDPLVDVDSRLFVGLRPLS